MTNTEAYRRGVADYHEGRSRLDNPYEPGDGEWKWADWNLGYDNAAAVAWEKPAHVEEMGR